MYFNIWAILTSSIVTLLVGFVWYNPKVCGTIWMKECNFTEESVKGANMALIFGLTFVLSFFAATMLNTIVIHQNGLFSALQGMDGVNEKTGEHFAYLENFKNTYGSNFRTFKHGAFHGLLTSIFMALPIIGINSLFERRSFKYIMIHFGFWAISFMIMGGIICAWT